MSENSVSIRELRLSTTLDPTRARSLAQRTADCLQTHLTGLGVQGEIGNIHLRVSASEARDPQRLAARIAQEVRRRTI